MEVKNVTHHVGKKYLPSILIIAILAKAIIISMTLNVLVAKNLLNQLTCLLGKLSIRPWTVADQSLLLSGEFYVILT